MLEVQYSCFLRILDGILLQSLVEWDLEALGYGCQILRSQPYGIAFRAAVSASLARKDHVAGHAIIIDCRVARRVQIPEYLCVRQGCGREELQSDIFWISIGFRQFFFSYHFSRVLCIGILFNLALPYNDYVQGDRPHRQVQRRQIHPILGAYRS